ncbi:glycosyltransferase family 4 protein [Aureimonas altamirensis]|uniref:glycosyltransferase family 4 protein n=1 Tax=Aureimonas altamirensis TaxID=370622 RepID=UPI0025530B01|nr:glycosyltransferase family 4 protein [Aureimonas altamirensis]
MRCCLLAWDYPPSPSGLSTAAREIAESLAAAGCDMTVVTLDRRGSQQEYGVRLVGAAIDEGSSLARLRQWGGIGHLAAPIAFRRTVAALHRERPFDIVEATNWYAPAALLGRPGDAPLVTRISTPAAYSRTAAQGVREKLDAMAADRLERRQIARSIGLISNSAEHARGMESHYGIGSGVPHAVIGLSLPPEFLAVAADAPFDAAGPARILFVGRAEERKGFAELLAAVERLAEEAETGSGPQFSLRLLGVSDADLPGGLSPAARARIDALGRQPQERLMREYTDAHIVAAPSRYESFGLVYQEALAFGRVLLASATDSSARDFVADGGVLAENTSADAITEALRPLIASADLRLHHRERALKAAGRFTRQSLARQTLDLYRAAIARHQGR